MKQFSVKIGQHERGYFGVLCSNNLFSLQLFLGGGDFSDCSKLDLAIECHLFQKDVPSVVWMMPNCFRLSTD